MGAISTGDDVDEPDQELIRFQTDVVDSLSSCLRGCKGLANRVKLRKALRSSFYFLEYECVIAVTCWCTSPAVDRMPKVKCISYMMHCILLGRMQLLDVLSMQASAPAGGCILA